MVITSFINVVVNAMSWSLLLLFKKSTKESLEKNLKKEFSEISQYRSEFNKDIATTTRDLNLIFNSTVTVGNSENLTNPDEIKNEIIMRNGVGCEMDIRKFLS
mmetsp:Transcript_39276/g.34972  ORF Transcript_39276/g.34972 Transcript_39276/m.34972 type:complete len:103 (+) Transcript_39276:1475-1783(+)